MGWASMFEDISERFYGSSLTGFSRYVGPAPRQRDIDEAKYLFGDPFERPERLVREFRGYYRREHPIVEISRGRWEKHLHSVEKLRNLILPISHLDQTMPSAWPVVRDLEGRLRSFFHEAEDYGPMSRSVFQPMYRMSKAIHERCKEVVSELRQFEKNVKTFRGEERRRKDLQQAVEELDDIRLQLDRDFQKMNHYEELIEEVNRLWPKFVGLFTRLAAESHYRPALQDLDRFVLNDSQERFVVRDHIGEYRLQGASGSGKTIILVHRALRLARENPTRHVRVFTINRALADLLKRTIRAVESDIPANLHVSAFYDFLLDCLVLFEPRAREKYRLLDDRSGERIMNAWRDFTRHRTNVFSEAPVRVLIDWIETRRTRGVDAMRYLRQEVLYIQSAYRKSDREQYLQDERRSRSINFKGLHRRQCLRILEAWEEYLDFGDLCDIDGLTVQAADHFESKPELEHIRQEMRTDFVLLDEVQDFSTLELRIVRKLVEQPSSQNGYFFVGDISQKVYPKHHDSRSAGFDFRGKAGILRQNFRNTRQILLAARNITQRFPPQRDEADDIEVQSPELSWYEGGKPIVFRCTHAGQPDTVMEILSARHHNRVAVVSENDEFLKRIRQEARRKGIDVYDLFRNRDLDRWREQGDALRAQLVVSRMEAVKGFEFDTVVACDLSEDVTPRPGTPLYEVWRTAAVVYTAFTRARDELIVTYAGTPSRFVDAMLNDVDHFELTSDAAVQRFLGRA